MERLTKLAGLLVLLAWCVPAHAAIAKTGNTNYYCSANSTSCVITFSASAGDFVWLNYVGGYGVTLSSATDSASNSGWTVSYTSGTCRGYNNGCGAVYNCSLSSGITSITITTSGNSRQQGVVISASGVATSSCHDAAAGSDATGTSTTPTCNAVTTSASGDLVLGDIRSTSSLTSLTANGSWSVVDANYGGWNGSIGATYQIVGAAGTYAAAGTANTSIAWGCWGDSYLAGAGGGGGGSGPSSTQMMQGVGD